MPAGAKALEPSPAPRARARKIRVGIVGTGGMAHTHAEAFAAIPGCELAAACDVDRARAEVFAAKFRIPGVFTDLDRFLAGGGVDAVAVVTPDKFHAPVSLACLKAGRHVLCEKPLATSYADAAKMAAAAKSSGVINMVNFSYRNAPAIQHAARLTAKGALGRILHVQGAYYQDWLACDAWGYWKTSPGLLWRLSTAHGSKGVLGDVGVHLLDFASLPAGPIRSVACLLKTFPKAPGDRAGEFVLDANDSAIITAEFEGGAAGALMTTRWAAGHRNSIELRLYGEEGALRIDLDRSWTQLELCKVRRRMPGPWTAVECKPAPTIWQRFISSIRSGVNDQPDFQRGAEIQKALDACEKSHKTGRAVPLA